MFRLFGFLLIVLSASLVFAESGHRHTSASDHAPIGVMGDHVHNEGEFMLSYRYMYMNMDGNRDGTTQLAPSQVLSDFMVSPTEMDMEMHMIGLMYAPSDTFTLMTMVPFIELSMDHVTRMGGRFSTRSSGIGDIRFTGLTKLLDKDNHTLLLNTGVSLPSGEIDERAATPMGPNQPLPYPMQLGSGTVDLLPGLTYTGKHDILSWGAQGIGTLRLGRNDNEYSLGDRFDSSVWTAISLCDWLSYSTRLAWSVWGNIDGADSNLNPMMVPTAAPHRRGGRRFDLGFGINLLVPHGPLKSLRFAAELMIPVYQNLNGPQLENDEAWIFGAQYVF